MHIGIYRAGNVPITTKFWWAHKKWEIEYMHCMILTLLIINRMIKNEEEKDRVGEGEGGQRGVIHHVTTTSAPESTRYSPLPPMGPATTPSSFATCTRLFAVGAPSLPLYLIHFSLHFCSFRK